MSARVRRRLDEMLRFPFIHSLHHTHCSSQKCAAQTLTDNCIVCIVGSSELSEPGGHDYAGSPQALLSAQITGVKESTPRWGLADASEQPDEQQECQSNDSNTVGPNRAITCRPGAVSYTHLRAHETDS